MTEMKAKLAYAFTAIVFGTLLADCNGNITCWKGSSEKGLKKVLCTGRSCYRAKYEHDSDIDYGCWYGRLQSGCESAGNVLYCVCSQDLCNNGVKQTDTLNTGGIPADVLSTGSIPADVLNTRGTLVDVLTNEGIPTDVLNVGDKPADVLNTEGISAWVLNIGGTLADVLNTEGISAWVLNIGGTLAVLLNTEGSGGRLTCWVGQEKRLRKRVCNGSCYKAKLGKVRRFGCFPNKRPDGCKQFGRMTFCFCNKDLCNTADIPTDTINTGGTPTDVSLNTGGVQIDVLSTGGLPKYVLNTEGIQTGDMNSGDISIEYLNTGGLSVDDLNTGGIPTDNLNNGGIPFDYLNTGSIRINDWNTAHTSSEEIITVDIPTVDLNTRAVQTGSDDNLICWYGENNRLEKRNCYGSCAKTTVGKDLVYGCLHMKKPDGCYKSGNRMFCFCNTNLCNTGSIPNKNLKTAGIILDDLDRGGVSTDDQNTGNIPTNIGSKPTYVLEVARDRSSYNLNTGFVLLIDDLGNSGIPTDLLNTRGMPTDILNDERLPTDYQNIEGTPNSALTTKDVSDNGWITGYIPTDETEKMNLGVIKTDALKSGNILNDILHTHRQKLRSILTIGEIPNDEQHTEKMSTDILHSGKLPTDELLTDKRPIDILNNEKLPSDVLHSDKMSNEDLFFKPYKN